MSHAAVPGTSSDSPALVVPLESVGLADIPQVGGKNASLGEMLRELGAMGVRVPSGFATTAAAYRLLLHHNGLQEPLRQLLATLDTDDLTALQQAGRTARQWLEQAQLRSEEHTSELPVTQ